MSDGLALQPGYSVDAPAISVVIPCYGQSHLLPQALASLAAQTFPYWEAIVVDDGSPDDTAAVVARHAQSDSRVKLLRKANGGLSSARNAGIAQARGQFLQFLDADDLLEAEKFADDISTLKNSPSGSVVISDYCFLNEKGERFTHRRCAPRFFGSDFQLEVAIRWETDLSIPVHSFLIDAKFFKESLLRFDESLPNHEDWDMWMQLFAFSPSVFYTRRIGSIYRISSNSMARNFQAMYAGFVKAISKHAIELQTRESLRHALKAKLALTEHYYNRGWRASLRQYCMSSVFTSVVPWPWQLALRKLPFIDVNAHAVALNKRFFNVCV